MRLVKTLPTTPLLLALLALFNASVEAVPTPLPSVRARRSSKGVELTSFNAQKYELCAGEYCIVKEKPPKKETIQLPPEITLQDYFIQWEICDGHQVTVVEATCPQVPFCENVQHWFCTANVLNPKCSPRAAIIVIAIGLCLTITLIYVLCYIPITLGIPCQILCKILVLCIGAVPRSIFQLWLHFQRRRERIRTRARKEMFLHSPLSLVVLLLCVSVAESCQIVDIFQLKTNVCIQSATNNETCTIDTTQMLKMTTIQLFHKNEEL
ncbi:hypothetical protein RB195_023479 [Necator americanus]|uniref:Phlebovirus glycoprotein G2 fusion domain-containing protein n=1 Tax=Necator americanus TaxID=51031 RepID=A0ABR1EJD2_NECAM